MYHPAVVEQMLEAVYAEPSFARLVPDGFTVHSVATCRAMVRQLDDLWEPTRGVLTRPLTREEEEFILHEQLRCAADFHYWAERYAVINRAGQRIGPLYPLWESQDFTLARIGEIQQRRRAEGHPDGIFLNVLKARQLGISTLTEALLVHRATTQPHFRALIASDVPGNSGSEGMFGIAEHYLLHLPWWLKPREVGHKKDSHVFFASGARLLVESGKSMKGGLQEQGGVKGNIGRSKTYGGAHLTELSTWERPEQIDDGLIPTFPIDWGTLVICESTGKGFNWWSDHWDAAEHGHDPRFSGGNVFIGWYVEQSKYWLPPPAGWIPSPTTLEHARRVEREAPRWMGHGVHLTRPQLFWWETHRALAESKGELERFLEEYPATPTEAFQFSGRSIFPLAVRERIDGQARPLMDVWDVRVAAEAAALRHGVA